MRKPQGYVRVDSPMAMGSLYGPLLEAVREAGVDPEPVLRQLGFTEASLLDRGARLSRKQGRALTRAITRGLGDSPIGLLAAERFAVADGDLLGYVLRCAACPLEAVQLMTRYARLWGDTAQSRVELSHGRVNVCLGLSGGYEMLDEAVDYALGVLFRSIREATGGAALPVEVRLPRARPRRADAYRRFFGAQMVFATEEAVLVYPEPAMRRPNITRDSRLLAILVERAEELLARLPAGDDLSAQVRASIALQLVDGEPAIREIAQRLGMSERTLRRKLRHAGLGYRELVEDVRRERTLALVESGIASVSALARQVGYADASTLARAVRRWTGMRLRELLGAPSRPWTRGSQGA
jgi:AraC-like DNA-binding protein